MYGCNFYVMMVAKYTIWERKRFFSLPTKRKASSCFGLSFSFLQGSDVFLMVLVETLAFARSVTYKIRVKNSNFPAAYSAREAGG